MKTRRSGILVSALFALLLGGCNEISGSTGTGGTGAATSTGGGGTGGATTTSSTTTTTTTMTAPLTCPVAVTTPPITNGECDLLQQNCAPGETCQPTADGTSTICFKGGGLKGPGKPCLGGAGVQECQSGLFCIGPASGAFCTRPCCPADDQPCGGGHCDVSVNFGNVTVLMCTYSETCELFKADQCKTGQQCQLLYPNLGLAVCTLPSDNPQPDGGTCAYVNECGASSICYGGTCHYNCLIDGGGAPGEGGCPDGQACSPAYPDYGFGICLPK